MQFIADSDLTTANNFGADSPVPQHCCYGPLSKNLLHTRTGMTEGRRFKFCFADSEPLMPECIEINAGYHQITSQQLWRNG